MKKIIRLTESDLTRIVKRVINEGGYQGIKNELIHDKGLLDFTTTVMHALLSLGGTIKKVKSLLKGDIFGIYQTNIALALSRKITVMMKRLTLLERLIRSFKEREMTLSKSDLDDYGFNLSKFLDDLQSRYDEIDELRDLTDDEGILEILDGYEEDINKLVDLLYEIPD